MRLTKVCRGTADDPPEREVAHADDGGGAVGRGHVRQRGVDVGGGQLLEPARADRGQDRLEHVPVLADRLGGPAGQAAGEPALGRLPHRVVRGSGPGASLQVAVQLSEPVGDEGLSLPGHLTADPLPVRAGPEADHPAPAAGAAPVPGRIGARPGGIEVDAVAAPPAPCRHEPSMMAWEPFREPLARLRQAPPGMPRHITAGSRDT